MIVIQIMKRLRKVLENHLVMSKVLRTNILKILKDLLKNQLTNPFLQENNFLTIRKIEEKLIVLIFSLMIF